MYEIRYRKQAAKALAKIPKRDAEKFLRAFRQLAQSPSDVGSLDAKPLKGRDGHRLRIGRWRALYRIVENQLLIEVIRIGARGDVYK